MAINAVGTSVSSIPKKLAAEMEEVALKVVTLLVNAQVLAFLYDNDKLIAEETALLTQAFIDYAEHQDELGKEDVRSIIIRLFRCHAEIELVEKYATFLGYTLNYVCFDREYRTLTPHTPTAPDSLYQWHLKKIKDELHSLAVNTVKIEKRTGTETIWTIPTYCLTGIYSL
jgi:hypothetical protein